MRASGASSRATEAARAAGGAGTATSVEELRERRLVRGLGWTSLAMGLALLAPAWTARLFGLGERPRLMIAIGARDLAIGLGLLRGRRPARWLCVHALADFVDAAIVGAGLRTSTVARWRGTAWLVGALAAGCASLAQARRSAGLSEHLDSVPPAGR